MGKIILVFAMCLVVGIPKAVLSDTPILDETQKWFDDLLEEIKNEVESAREKRDVYYQQIKKSIEDFSNKETELLDKKVEDKMKIMIRILDAYNSNCNLIGIGLRSNKSRAIETIKTICNKQIEVTNNLSGRVDREYEKLIALIDIAKNDRHNCTSTYSLNTESNITPVECIKSVGFNLLDKKIRSLFFINVEKFVYHKRIAKERVIKDTSATIRLLKDQIRTFFPKVKSCLIQKGYAIDEGIWRFWVAE